MSNEFNDYLKYLKFELDMDEFLKKKGLNKILARDLLIPYLCNVKPIIFAQKLGIHKKTVIIYYKVFGKLKESEFETLFFYLFNRKFVKERRTAE